MVQWIYLYMSCPVSSTGCSKTQNPNYWYHSNCGGSMKISTEAYMRCESCSEYGHWKEWSFSCSNHPLHYKVTDDRDFLRNLNFVTSLHATSDEMKTALKQIMKKIIDEM
jgi:hypothetical protein